MHKTEKKVAKLKDEVRRQRRQNEAKRNAKRYEKEQAKKKAEQANGQNQAEPNGKKRRKCRSRFWTGRGAKEEPKPNENGNPTASGVPVVESLMMNQVGTAPNEISGAEVHNQETYNATDDRENEETRRIRGGGKRRRNFMRSKKKQQRDEETGELYGRG